jgi:hypothetical protein
MTQLTLNQVTAAETQESNANSIYKFENSGPGFIFMTVLDLVLLAGGMAVYLISRKRTAVNASA